MMWLDCFAGQQGSKEAVFSQVFFDLCRQTCVLRAIVANRKKTNYFILYTEEITDNMQQSCNWLSGVWTDFAC